MCTKGTLGALVEEGTRTRKASLVTTPHACTYERSDSSLCTELFLASFLSFFFSASTLANLRSAIRFWLSTPLLTAFRSRIPRHPITPPPPSRRPVSGLSVAYSPARLHSPVHFQASSANHCLYINYGFEGVPRLTIESHRWSTTHITELSCILHTARGHLSTDTILIAKILSNASHHMFSESEDTISLAKPLTNPGFHRFTAIEDATFASAPVYDLGFLSDPPTELPTTNQADERDSISRSVLDQRVASVTMNAGSSAFFGSIDRITGNAH